MRTVTYKTVLDKANVLFAGKIAATVDDTIALNRFINSRYREFYERFYWPEWTVVERRTFRRPYNGSLTYAASTPAAPVEVYYWPTQGYYQSLRAQPLIVDTLTRSGTTATGVVSAGHELATGDHPRITISGVTPTEFNGTWPATITGALTFTYELPADPGADGSGAMLMGINPADSGNRAQEAYWAQSEYRYNPNDWTATASYAVGNQIYSPLDGNFYQCIRAHTNQQPPNATFWGVLTSFKRDIDFEGGTGSNQAVDATAMGEVKGVWNDHPWVVEDAGPQSFDLTSDGLVVRGSEPLVWVEFRLRPNDFTGAPWTAGNYAVGTQVYYSVTGEYYECIATTTAEPPTDTAFWVKLDFPYVLKDAVAQAAFADLLKTTGKTSKWGEELREAHRLLQREFDKIERQQGQTRSLNVQTR